MATRKAGWGNHKDTYSSKEVRKWKKRSEFPCCDLHKTVMEKNVNYTFRALRPAGGPEERDPKD
jgi:hypothetical protein